jgi:probable rRNA maturation factor
VNKIEIHFYAEDIKYTLPGKKKIREWISIVFQREKKKCSALNYIFCNDTYLLNLNKKYLQHDTYTDILTFNNGEIGCPVKGDIFISIERVRENSKIFNTYFSGELHRVMIHGVLHLIGYQDKTSDESELMRSKEDYYLSLLSNFIPG